MIENIDEKTGTGFEDLEKFYTAKKNEQEALRRLLDALENASKINTTEMNHKEQSNNNH